MQAPPLILETFGPVARLRLNRPEAMNALNFEIFDAFDQYLPSLAADPAIRVLVLTGTGAAFCAGADLKQAMSAAGEAGAPDFLDRARELFEQLGGFPKPVIAALNGITMAGGLEIAMCADIVIACESARIGDSHANYGVFPGGGGAAVLPRLLPLNTALYLLFTGKTVSAAELQQLGFVSEVHPDADLMDAAIALGRHIAAKSPLALQRMKAVARASLDKSRADALLHEQVMLRRHQRSADLLEGLRAFAEKDTPLFLGR